MPAPAPFISPLTSSVLAATQAAAQTLYICTVCGKPCDPKTEEIWRHATGMQHVGCVEWEEEGEAVAGRDLAAPGRVMTDEELAEIEADCAVDPYRGVPANTRALIAEVRRYRRLLEGPGR